MALTEFEKTQLLHAFGDPDMAIQIGNILDQAADTTWLDSVATSSNLPSSGNTTGDTRTTIDTGAVFVWNGSSWVNSSVLSGIGSSVLNGTNKSILFVDSSGNLAQDNSSFSYNSTTKALTVGAATTVSQTLYVSKSGNDSTGNGTQLNPYLTIEVAQNAISDASSSKIYVINIGPGTYIESTTFALKDWVYLNGSGMFSTFVKKSNNSAIVWSPSSNMDSRTQGINVLSCSNLWFIGAVNVTRLTTDICYAVCQFVPIRCFFVNGFTYNGTGLFQDSSALTFNDIFSPINCISTSTMNLNSVGNATTSPGVTGCLFTGTVNYNGDTGTLTTVVATVTAVDFAGAHTVTVAAGSGFIASPSGGIAAIQKQNGGGKFTYTSYNDATGVFSGAALTGGSISVSSIITNAGNQSLVLLNTPTGNVTVTATKNQCLYTTVGGGKGAVAAQTITLSGTESFYSSDVIGGYVTFPTLNNGALPSQVLRGTTPITLGVSLFASGNWTTAPTHVSDELKNIESMLFNMNGRQTIPWQGTFTGTKRQVRTGLTTPITVANLTASFITVSAITTSSTTVTPISMGGLTTGLSVTGTGIPANTTISTVGASTITLNNAATATNASASLTFSTTTTADYYVESKLTSPGAVAVNLPAGTAGLTYVIADGTGDASSNTITINAAGSDTFSNGTGSDTITTNFGSKTYIFNSGKWRLIASA